ncbi:protein spire homolog 1 isoform X2 [Patella vulgata]|uniref:protein spire homolog 1 isoform X2 n=1 Tax=Patella vulgata TaxID=6465 RepID=UPI00217F6E49|nr:protein spire homolog 1 isoform X2 [Patella vulgata]
MANTASSRSEISVKDQLSLYDILKVFNNPINEEQAWAICYQCAQYFSVNQPQVKLQEFFLYGIQALRLRKDGEVIIDTAANASGSSPTRRSSIYHRKGCIATEGDAVRALGATIFKALDYGLHENEERQLSHDLENLIELMTHYDEEEDESQTADDEGIEKDAEDEYESRDVQQHCSFIEVSKLCARHLSSRQDARHYKAVCRALVAEAQELISFLDKISNGQQNLTNQGVDNDTQALDDLESSDWTTLWVQIMRQLRQGVRLKKVEHVNFTPVEFELTPFEILLEDIRSRRYALHKIMVNGELPHKVKTDAHNVILDFIRSRPPLKKAKDRKLKTLPPNPPDPHECLLQDIRSQPKLRSVKEGKLVVETSRTKLDSSDEEESPPPVRKIIKPDFNLLLNNSFDEDDYHEETDEEKKKLEATMSPLSPVTPVADNPSWQQAVVRDATTGERRQCTLQRRHTIMVCESPTDGKVVQQELPPLEEVADEPCSPPAQAPSDPLHFTSPESVHTSCCGVTQRHSSQKNNNQIIAPKKRETKGQKLSTCLGAISEADDSITDVGCADISQLNATELMHVSWKSACCRTSTNSSAPCPDCRPVPKRWKNPIECLNLTLEEVTHIRSVLTKAELESLITQPTLYNQVAKSKICFTCKKIKFSLFGEWGTKCKFCKRSVCSKCLRKMNIPTEHFKNIPVHTLSPGSPSHESKEAMNRLVSFAPTGSNPVTPSSSRKQDKDIKNKKSSLQRSQSMYFKPSPAKVLKGPLVNICHDCKDMTLEIIRAGRTSIALINQGKEPHLKVVH